MAGIAKTDAALLSELRALIEQARHHVAQILATLSQDLVRDYGKAFNLSARTRNGLLPYLPDTNTEAQGAAE